MKKILAVLLCLLCIVSSMAVSVSGAGIEDVFVQIGSTLGFEQDEPIGYGIKYDSNKLLSGVTSVMYEPRPTVKLSNPGTYTVTDDYPLAVDYSFVCWEDKDIGKYYYPGDKIYIDGEITLYAVWEEKTDNNIRPLRVFLTAFQALKKSIQSFFGVFKYERVENLNNPDFYWFDVEFYFTEDQLENGIGVGREFTIRVKVPDGVTFDSFSKTQPLYLGGVIEPVAGEEYIYAKDENGNYITDEKGNRIIEDVNYTVKNQLVRATEYSARYDTIGDKDGEYQLIEISLTDRVPNPSTREYVTFSLPRGILRYTDAAGNKYYSNAASVSILSSKDQ